jgi:ribosomal protein S12 methylthiotransferase
MRCKTPDELVAEGRELIADGARELILIGQDTTSYGADIGYDGGLGDLLRHLDRRCGGADWIRLMYVYPSVFTDEMIDAIASCERVVKYIDIPLQHISDRMLRSMGRRVTRREQEVLLEKLRTRIPEVTIRTTFIVGFPGETEADFAELLDFVRSFEFDAVGAFRYSFEPETPSGRMPGQLDAVLKDERYERLMLAQQETVFKAARRRIGATFKLVVDGPGPDGACIGRHAGQAPEVDSVCKLPSGDFDAGDVLNVRCVETEGYDLIVQPVARALPVM